jgi:hypothetical protein
MIDHRNLRIVAILRARFLWRRRTNASKGARSAAFELWGSALYAMAHGAAATRKTGAAFATLAWSRQPHLLRYGYGWSG